MENMSTRYEIQVGPIDNLILFGGGLLVVEFAKEAIKKGIKTHIFAVKRHLDEIINGKNSLQKILKKEKISYYCVKDINSSPKFKSLILKKTMGIGLGEAYTFSKETVKMFNGNLFDFMVIRLPQYRGGAHFTWQILQGDKKGCWNIQVINEEMVPGVYDSGKVLKTKKYKIPEWAKIPADYFKVARDEGLKLFREFIGEVKYGKKFKLIKLQENNSSYFPRLYTLNHGFINWSWNSAEIEKFICAFDEPYIGASTFIDGTRVFLKNCQAKRSEGEFHPFMSGLIYRIYNNCVFVATKGGAIAIGKVLDKKGNNVIKSLKVGQRFYTPLKYIEEAMHFEASYDSEGLVKKGY